MKGLIGRKLGMTQIFKEQGESIPVTVLEVGPCYVTQLKTDSNDGYSAVQIGFDEVKARRLTGGERGHLKNAHTPSLRVLHEFRVKPEDLDIIGSDRSCWQTYSSKAIMSMLSALPKARAFRVASSDIISIDNPRRMVNLIVSALLALRAPVRRLAKFTRASGLPGTWDTNV